MRPSIPTPTIGTLQWTYPTRYWQILQKTLNASEMKSLLSIHSSRGGGMSKRLLGGNIGCKDNTRGQSAHPKIPLEKFSPSGGVSSGILPSRGILKNIILCRHKTFNPPEGLIPCMPCRGKTYKIPLAFFSISTPAGFNLVENSGGKT